MLLNISRHANCACVFVLGIKWLCEEPWEAAGAVQIKNPYLTITRASSRCVCVYALVVYCVYVSVRVVVQCVYACVVCLWCFVMCMFLES